MFNFLLSNYLRLKVSEEKFFFFSTEGKLIIISASSDDLFDAERQQWEESPKRIYCGFVLLQCLY